MEYIGELNNLSEIRGLRSTKCSLFFSFFISYNLTFLLTDIESPLVYVDIDQSIHKKK